MYFLINYNKKIIFGWSAKCGCTHIKNLFYFFESGKTINVIHTLKDKNKLPYDYEKYTIILFIRNPYERLVSGFLDKYREFGDFVNIWKKNTNLPLTFTNFINELSKSNFNLVDKHHFTPQLSEEFDIKLFTHKNLLIYDIKKIDYDYLEILFNTKIPIEVKKFYGNHIHKSKEIITYDIYDLLIKDYYHLKPYTYCFYNKELLSKVYAFYKIDFDFFRGKHFYYTIY